MIEYYLIWYRLDGIDGHLIWTEDDQGVNGVLLDDVHNLRSFPQADLATRFLAGNGWQLAENAEAPRRHEFDSLREWLTQPDADHVDCEAFLDAWNLFTDCSVSVSGQQAFVPRTALNDTVYDKLFYGCNLPSITPAGEHYVPVWPPEEIAELRNTLHAGLTLFTTHLAAT